MGDIDCDFGDCDCDCDFDCCCCCCCCDDDFSWCCDDCCSSGGDTNLCCCIVCIGSNDGNRHKKDSNYLPWLCCCFDDSRKRRTASSEQPYWPREPKHKSSFEVNKEERERRKEPGSKHATYPTCYSCRRPLDISPRYGYPEDDFDWGRPKCSRCLSIPPPPFEPPIHQQFHKLDHEKHAKIHRMYN